MAYRHGVCREIPRRDPAGVRFLLDNFDGSSRLVRRGRSCLHYPTHHLSVLHTVRKCSSRSRPRNPRFKVPFERPKGTVEESHGHVHDFKIRGKHLHLHQHPDVGSHNHIHEHSEKFLSLAAIAGFALVLGFAHEEEFALLALVVAGIDPLIMMLLYAGAVTAALTGISVVSVKAYSKFEARLKKYEGLLPKVSGIVLLITAMTFLLGLR